MPLLPPDFVKAFVFTKAADTVCIFITECGTHMNDRYIEIMLRI